jgi:hypothetical protein
MHCRPLSEFEVTGSTVSILKRFAPILLVGLTAATGACGTTEVDEPAGQATLDASDTGAGAMDPVDFTVEVMDACTPGTHCRRTLNVTDGVWVWSDTEGPVDITDELSTTLKDEVYADLLHALQFGCPATVGGADFSRSASLWIDGVELSPAQGCLRAIGDVGVNTPGFIGDDLDAALALAATAAGCPAAYNPYTDAERFENSIVVNEDAERFICW